ncbi:MAG TPA: GAF domain-containing protein [Flavitalea sp.]|nr:GAF domain-containing protein [Flavitalea sp.]
MENPDQKFGRVNELLRLRDLYSYAILDSVPEPDFEELAELAANISNCPIAAITFIDQDRQWFKAKVGDKVRETPRDISFCAHTILTDESLVVEDATKDLRFAANPDVTGGLNIRFYTGVPIKSVNNRNIGAVCVIDQHVRSINASEVKVLQLIASQVSKLLELRLSNEVLLAHTKKALESLESSFESFFNQAGIPNWIYDIETLAFLQVNEAALSKYGYTRDEFQKMTMYDVRTDAEKKNIHQLAANVRGNNKLCTFNSAHQTKDGSIIKVEITISDVTYLGRPARMASIIDVTEKEKLKHDLIKIKRHSNTIIKAAKNSARQNERDHIGKELHDNINQMLACTKLLLDTAYSEEDVRLEMIRRSRENIVETIKQVRSLSHTLVIKKNSFDLNISIQELLGSYSTSNSFAANFITEGELDKIPSDLAVTLFRIIQEQVNNIVKHSKATNVTVILSAAKIVTLEITDNGVGFDVNNSKEGIGLRNISQRVCFYNGVFKVSSKINIGTTILITVPLKLKKIKVRIPASEPNRTSVPECV